MLEPADLRIRSTADLAPEAAGVVAALLREAVHRRGAATLALSGGTTPRALHEALVSHAEVPWAHVFVYFGDERAVPPTHEDSNYLMAKESLLERVPIPESNVHRMHAEEPDRDAAARAYEAVLPPSLDLVLLGIGEDGHTASLFPGHASLAETQRKVLPVVGPKPPPERLTLTPPALAAARRRLMLAAGAGKAEAVARALEGPWDPSRTPAQLARDGIWYVDEAAARLLSSR